MQRIRVADTLCRCTLGEQLGWPQHAASMLWFTWNHPRTAGGVGYVPSVRQHTQQMSTNVSSRSISIVATYSGNEMRLLIQVSPSGIPILHPAFCCRPTSLVQGLAASALPTGCRCLPAGLRRCGYSCRGRKQITVRR